MKNILLFLFSLIVIINKLSAQEEVYELHLTSDFRYTDNPNFTYTRFLKLYKDVWAYTDFDRKKNKIQTGFFTDSTLSKQTGPNRFYDNGKLVYEGNFENGYRTGWWYFYDSQELLSDSLFYKPAGKELTAQAKKDTVLAHEKKDTSKLVNNVEIEADYPGGAKSWKRYLEKTIRYPDLAVQTSPTGQYRSLVQFVVCSDGSICDIVCVKSTHPLLDLEAVNAIRKGTKWMPAEQNGRKVKAYRTQPIIFSIE